MGIWLHVLTVQKVGREEGEGSGGEGRKGRRVERWGGGGWVRDG
jgi:hypothetical protein